MNSANPRHHEINMSVPFHDLDPVQIVWHGNYLKYFDMARFGLFKKAGIDLYEFYEKSRYLFPVTKTSTKHIQALKYGDEFVCRAEVTDARVKIVLDFEIRRLDDGIVCTRGRSEQVALKAPEMELMLQIPNEIRSALGF